MLSSGLSKEQVTGCPSHYFLPLALLLTLSPNRSSCSSLGSYLTSGWRVSSSPSRNSPQTSCSLASSNIHSTCHPLSCEPLSVVSLWPLHPSCCKSTVVPRPSLTYLSFGSFGRFQEPKHTGPTPGTQSDGSQTRVCVRVISTWGLVKTQSPGPPQTLQVGSKN